MRELLLYVLDQLHGIFANCVRIFTINRNIYSLHTCTPFLVSIVLQRFQAPDAKIRINTFNKRTHFSPHCDIQLVVQIKHKHFVIFGFQKMFKIVYYLYIDIGIPLVSHAVLVYIMAKSPLTSVLSKYKSIHTQPQPYICHSKIVFGFYHNR